MQDYLPDIPRVSREPRRDRNPFEGYQRAWGLQYGDLREKVLRDPLYIEAAELARGRSILYEDHRINLYLILRFYLARVPFGHIIEFGSYRGGNAMFMARVAQRLHPAVKVYALDTFSGMPEADSGVDAHVGGDLDDVDLEELLAFARRSSLVNLEFRKGLFQETAPPALAEAGAIALAHIDCDIHSAVAYSYDLVRDAMVDGGYIILDDARVSSCLGATEAIEERAVRRDGLHAEQVHPHLVFRAPPRDRRGLWSPRDPGGGDNGPESGGGR